MKKSFTYDGYKIVFDSTEIFPDDPGNGTPLMVYGPRGSSATYQCAMDTGEIENDRLTQEIPAHVHRWLVGLEVTLWELMEKHTP